MISSVVALNQLSQVDAAAPKSITVSLSEIESEASNFKGQIQEAEMVYDISTNGTE